MEEIIIDGVNVAECEYMLNNKIKGKQHCPAKAMPYAKETSCICRKSIDTPYNFCKHNPNCHYKQLKCLEQENERLHERILKLTEENGSLIVQNNTLKENFEGQRNAHKQLNKQYKKLKAYLQEIKEIAEKPKLFKDFSEIKTATEVEYDYAAVCNELELRLHKVLELITKAEEE